MGALCALSLAGCVDKDLYHGPEVKPAEEFFDFTTSSNCTVDLDYGLNYQVVFELYAENPVSEDAYGNLVRTKEEPVYRGATDKKGVFNDFISIPSYLTELYLYSDYLGTVNYKSQTIKFLLTKKLLYKAKEIRKVPEALPITGIPIPTVLKY